MKKEKKIFLFTGMPLGIAKGVNVCMFFLSVLCSLISILQVYVVSDFINAAMLSVEKRGISSSLIITIILLMATVALDWIMPRINGLLRKKAELALLKEYRPKLLKKCAALSYTYMEQADSQNLISRVLEQTERKWQDIYQAMLALLKLLISIAGILFIIASYVWWAAVLIFLFCLPLFYFSVRGGKVNYQARRDTSQYIRKYSYLDSVLNNREYVDERSLFGYTGQVNEQYAEAYREAFGIETKTQIYWAIKTKLSGGLSAIAALLIVITLIQPTLSGKIPIGLFVSLVNAVFLLTNQMSWGLSRNIDALVGGNEFCRDIHKFLSLPEEEGALDLPDYMEAIKTIEFRHVSFSYPGTDFCVLKDVSFVMNWGKNYALVGANGAGKTTVIKLLTGLYESYEGEILINGKELRHYKKSEQKGMFSVVYQDYIQHALTVRENCEIGDPCSSVPEEKMRDLIDSFDLKKTIEALPMGYDTLLGKIREGGMDISGGQWQKLAMIRALLRPAKVRILDEPTASLDPKMESEIYSLFRKMAEETLTILISHRLGFARLADEILVFENGSVCEQGAFPELMEKRGLFCHMYEEQRSWYE
ncbi:MAG: ABC transporter ATP-binding protein [Eubacterium sp.]|nr:ABC transporter ATP-binding protein [Eubacterium sp.]